MKKGPEDNPYPHSLRRDNPNLPPLAAIILRLLEQRARMTVTDFVREYALRHTTRSTLKLHLRRLVSTGLARRHGRGKATWYTP